MSPAGPRATHRVALVTCRDLPDADPDTRLLIPLLASRGVDATPAVWDDPHQDWSAYDLAIVRSCWDYHLRRREFLEWAARVPRLANPRPLLSWNSDKRYLRDLARRGIPVVPTRWVRPTAVFSPGPSSSRRRCVIKPAIGLACQDAGCYDLGDAEQRRLAREHLARLQRRGVTAMVQPYLAAVEHEGETSLVFLRGVFSHAMRKGALLDGPDRGLDRRFVPQGGIDLRPRWPTPAQLDVARRALEVVPHRGPPLYARVDLVPGADGLPTVLELELIEPQLYFALVDDAAQAFADRVVEMVRVRGEEPRSPSAGQGCAQAQGS